MGYRLEDSERFSDGIQRIVLEQVDEALDHLKPTVRNKDEAIHDARVCIKKVRSVLRLVRDPLGNEIFERADASYRDIARKLSKVRDSAAMLEIISKLTDHFSDQVSPDAFAGVRARLRRSKKERDPERERAITAASKSLREVRERVKEWPEVGHSQALSGGLKRVFKKGRTRLDAAYRDPTVENFHEWRKWVKHLLYQTRVLRPLWGEMMKA